MRTRAINRYVPPEHGAWAMLLVPFLLGTFSADPSWWSVLLLVSWLTAYLASYYGIRWLKTRRLSHRGARFRAPAALYLSTFAVTAVALAVSHPWLVAAGAAFVPFEAVAAGYALKGRDRSWVCT